MPKPAWVCVLKPARQIFLLGNKKYPSQNCWSMHNNLSTAMIFGKSPNLLEHFAWSTTELYEVFSLATNQLHAHGSNNKSIICSNRWWNMKQPFAQLILNECLANYDCTNLHDNFSDMISSIVHKLNATLQDYIKIKWINIKMAWMK